ncbi:MAG TPA: VOC family protein [Candidatus Dormibacteraeota bacterium]
MSTRAPRQGPLAAFGVPSHMCLVVPDRERAIAEMAPVFGEFVRTVPRAGGTHIISAAGRQTVRLSVAWTLSGPVHLELIESLPGTVWEPRAAGYLHHFGFQVEDLARASDELVAAGMTIEVTRWQESGRPLGFAYQALPGGLRIELSEGGPPDNLQALWEEQSRT